MDVATGRVYKAEDIEKLQKEMEAVPEDRRLYVGEVVEIKGYKFRVVRVLARGRVALKRVS